MTKKANHLAAKIFIGLFNLLSVFGFSITLLSYTLKNICTNPRYHYTHFNSAAIWGLILSTVFAIISGVLYHYSNKEKKDENDPDENGPTYYRALIIINSIMIIISIMALLYIHGILKIKRKNFKNASLYQPGESRI
jgi:hypothetical protein